MILPVWTDVNWRRQRQPGRADTLFRYSCISYALRSMLQRRPYKKEQAGSESVSFLPSKARLYCGLNTIPMIAWTQDSVSDCVEKFRRQRRSKPADRHLRSNRECIQVKASSSSSHNHQERLVSGIAVKRIVHWMSGLRQRSLRATQTKKDREFPFSRELPVACPDLECGL